MKQWQDHLMLICMSQVRLKISNSCVDAFSDAERQFQLFFSSNSVFVASAAILLPVLLRFK
jgi:hypothetical protein